MAIHSPELMQQSAINEQPGSDDDHGASVSAIRWTPATRISFRFCFAYLLLFSLSNQIVQLLIIDLIPKVRIPKLDRLWPMRQITSWTADHLFHVAVPLHPTGSGDTAFDWVETFCVLVAAIVATAVWTFLDRRRNNYIKLHKWFRVFLRFALASQMLVYGFMKVFALQMSSPDLLKLVELYGNFSPMAVLWTSIGVAPAYRFFAGSAELLGGLLLLLPVTSMLGALVCAADMAMVFVLNMSYDVPVKILSFHLLLIALFLLAPDVRRLIDFFFTNRATAARGGPQLFQGMRANRLALACQLLLGAYLAGFTLQKDIQYWYEWGGGSPKPALYGIWEVKEMAIDGQVRPSLLTDAQRWRRVIFESFGDIEIQGMDESVLYFKSFQQASMLNLDDKGPFPIVGYPGHPGLSGKFAIDRLAPDELTLDGTMGGHNIHTELRRVDLRQFTLVSRGFHWISEYPFQR